jgi:tRNA U34 5-methylaminomethyl-2-thiouridine-forming methyltransferase MnmC
MFTKLQVFATKNNDFTLYNPDLDETYHSRNGAISESLHVFIKEGLNHYKQLHPEKNEIKILEVGFGTGLNAILTLAEAENKIHTLHYQSLETYILPLELVQNLQLHQLLAPPLIEHFNQMHQCSWNKEEAITPNFFLTKYQMRLQDFSIENAYDIVYFDAFAPEKQPELWTQEALGIVARSLIKGGILVTYSSKGDVKRALKYLGLQVERIAGPPYKRHMLRATKPIK